MIFPLLLLMRYVLFNAQMSVACTTFHIYNPLTFEFISSSLNIALSAAMDNPRKKFKRKKKIKLTWRICEKVQNVCRGISVSYYYLPKGEYLYLTTIFRKELTVYTIKKSNEYFHLICIYFVECNGIGKCSCDICIIINCLSQYKYILTYY